MSKEIGPQEHALREQREARYARNVPARNAGKTDLTARVAEAAKKTGKPRKTKK